jgi:hypothetical protein
MAESFECMLVVSQMADDYPPGDANVTFYPNAETVVAEPASIQLLAKSETAKVVIELDMSDGDLHSFLEQLAKQGLDVTDTYEGVVWKFSKSD